MSGQGVVIPSKTEKGALNFQLNLVRINVAAAIHAELVAYEYAMARQSMKEDGSLDMPNVARVSMQSADQLLREAGLAG